MARLTPTEKQDIIRFLDADKPLPDKYRFLLFEEKREVELVWNGKISEVCNLVLPFQVIEQVDEPRAESTKEAPSLFNMDARGRQGNTVAAQLTDFSVYYSQDSTKAAA